MHTLKQYLVKQSFSTRNDINNICGIISLCCMLIIWDRVESAELRVISTIAIVYGLLVIMNYLKYPEYIAKKKHQQDNQQNKAPIASKQAKRASLSSKILTYLVFGLALGSVFFKDVWLLFMSLGLSFGIGIYETIWGKKLRKVFKFYNRVYLSGGIFPYVLGILSVVFTITLAVFLSTTSSQSSLLHFHWQPFTNGVEGHFIAAPIRIATANSLGLIVLIPLFFLFLAAFPYLAYEEEKIFRHKRTSVTQIIRGAVIFGLVHIITGIPFFACLALIGSGTIYSLYYLYHYKKYLSRNLGNSRRAALLALIPATSIHTIHNSIVILAVFCFSFFENY